MTDEELERRLSELVEDRSPADVPPFRGVVEGRRRRRRARTAIVGGAAAVAALAIGVPWSLAGGSHPDPAPAPATRTPDDPTTSPRPEPTYEWSDTSSPVVLRLPARDLELPTFGCWRGPAGSDGIAGGRCTDGFFADEALDHVGYPDTVELWFGRPGWRFDATFRELGERCPRSFTVPATPSGDRSFRIDPAGPAGRYRVDLFGRGPEGDVYTSFTWSTPTDGPVDPPRATVALVTDLDDRLTSYGLEVSVQDLAEQPETASVEVTATAANGRSMTLTAPWRDEGRRCYEHGSLFFDANGDPGVGDLGPAPFTYQVTLTLDGEKYVGTAVWPRDETKHEAPNTVLTFDPPLPGSTG